MSLAINIYIPVGIVVVATRRGYSLAALRQTRPSQLCYQVVQLSISCQVSSQLTLSPVPIIE